MTFSLFDWLTGAEGLESLAGSLPQQSQFQTLLQSLQSTRTPWTPPPSTTLRNVALTDRQADKLTVSDSDTRPGFALLLPCLTSLYPASPAKTHATSQPNLCFLRPWITQLHSPASLIPSTLTTTPALHHLHLYLSVTTNDADIYTAALGTLHTFAVRPLEEGKLRITFSTLRPQ